MNALQRRIARLEVLYQPDEKVVLVMLPPSKEGTLQERLERARAAAEEKKRTSLEAAA